MARILGLEGMNVLQAGDAKSGLHKLAHADIDVILCDVKLPDASGVALCEQIKQQYPLVEVILLTAYGNIPDGVQAIKNGAFDYITKGDDQHRIIPLVNKALDKVALAKRVQQLEAQVGKKYSFDSILGSSKQIADAISLARKVSQTDTTVLLLGETGTGKEVFAQAIHYNSDRRDKPFVAINCAAFGKELLESELFGYKAGAFTGALKDKKGLFEAADQGTLFLDEIGEMELALQAKLLRVLETGTFIKVGDTSPTKVSVRIIAATNRNLEQAAEEGTFRSDLYYRLSVFAIPLPSLQERRKDIGQIATHYAETFAAKINKRTIRLSEAYIQALEQHQWKGNIRELKNVIERSVILADSDVLDAATLPYEIVHSTTAATKSVSGFALCHVEEMHIRKVLQHTKGNKAEAARLLGIGIATLYRKIEEYKIS